MLADREFEEAVPKALEITLTAVRRRGTEGSLERYHKQYAHLLHYGYSVDIGEDDSFRRVYALTYVLFSEDRDAIASAAETIGSVIETEL